MKIYRLYCDGAFDHQQKVGAVAYSIVEDNKILAREAFSERSASANLMEMSSVLSALEEVISFGATKIDVILIYTDFKPICDAFDKGWLKKWSDNGWVNSDKRPVKHREEWEAISHLVDQLQIQFVYEKKDDAGMLRKLKKDARKALRLI